MSAVFAMDDIHVSFGGVVALDGVGLDVEPGQIHGVIGPNGAGKTTLFNVACGFVLPDTGAIHVSGVHVERMHPHHLARHGIARTLQGLGLFEPLSVVDNVMLGADRHSRSGFVSGLFALPRSRKDESALRERAMAVMADLGLDEFADAPSGALPYPTRKRVALARALVSEPSLLLLDEPASGLSETEMTELGDLILGLRDSVSVLLVEHHMDLVMRVCDRITVLDFGKVIAAGTPDEVRSDPAVLAAYLGDVVEASDADGDAAPASEPARSSNDG